MVDYRSGKLAVVWTASDSEGDVQHAGFIRKELDWYRIESHHRIASAHKSAALALEIIDEYANDERQIAYCTCAGRSDGLSAFVSGHSPYPVIACPPVSDGENGAYGWSSIEAPSKSSPLFVKEPKNAARAIATIFALGDHELRDYLDAEMRETRTRLTEADKKVHPAA